MINFDSVIYNLHHISIKPDRYRSVPIFISDTLSVSIGTDFFGHDFHNRERLERSDSDSDKRQSIAIDPLQKPNGNTSEMIVFNFEFK